MAFYVYLLTNRPHGTFYTGVTNNLVRRTHEHREMTGSTFTRRYGITRLVYYEIFDTPEEAIRREKRLKRWPRDWKIRTVEAFNPGWLDLYEDLNR
ncbi:GIY-YIG nuclease family protein [Roseibium sp.]|uniref:GIY-YIG nuclease family protein n=1 Tax=Roseibium sp. TaxID=1936156 RepID=UPI003A96E207